MQTSDVIVPESVLSCIRGHYFVNNGLPIALYNECCRFEYAVCGFWTNCGLKAD